MIRHIVKILKIEEVTHSVKRFTVEKPAGYSFIAGQATDVAINQDGLENELRPFTFTSLNEWDYLEFTIKIYLDHDGITRKLSLLSAGDELIIHEVFGTIRYKGPGLFIAGGAGITPFIAILRQLNQQGGLAGNTLLFANHHERDIILKDELEHMMDGNYIDVITEPENTGVKGRTIDPDLLKGYIFSRSEYYYICGPDGFVSKMIEHLERLGIENTQIIIEA